MFDGMKYRRKLWSIERECAKIRRKYDAYEENASAGEKKQIRGEAGDMLWPLYDQIDMLKTLRMRQIADRLVVPLPDTTDEKLWRDLHYGRGSVLTPKGLSEVRKLIRQEKREKREAVVAWLAALTGIIGALTGLLAVWGQR